MNYKKILVASDMHMTSGKDPCTGVWSATEDFFWDNDFARFLQFYENDSPSIKASESATSVLNCAGLK